MERMRIGAPFLCGTRSVRLVAALLLTGRCLNYNSNFWSEVVRSVLVSVRMRSAGAAIVEIFVRKKSGKDAHERSPIYNARSMIIVAALILKDSTFISVSMSEVTMFDVRSACCQDYCGES
jgi:hypothetical protein